MKKYILIIIAMSITLFWTSCEKDELGPTLLSDIKGPVLKAPAEASFILNEDNAADVFTKFTWEKADYGFNAAATYSLQIAKEGNNFKKIYDLGVTSKNELELTIADANNAFLVFGLIENQANKVEFRVMSVLNKKVDTVYSNTIKLDITPYYSEINYPIVFVPGGYQGWSPSDSTTVIYSINSDSKYEGYLYMGSGYKQGFKITGQPDWGSDDYIYGDDGSNSGVLANPGSDIKVADSEDMYFLIADISEMTYSLTKTIWSIFGTATGNTDINSTYDEGTKLLSVTSDLSAGSFIFRANGADEIIYGDENGNMKLDASNSPIEIAEAGNYTITMNLNKPPYKYTVTKN